MRSSLLVAALATLAVACADAAPAEETASSEGAASATARAKLTDFTGAWRVVNGDPDKRLPERIVITVTDDSVDPTTGDTKGTRLRLMRADNPKVPAIDHAPFVRVDEGKSCTNVPQGGTESVTICHDTKLSANGTHLEHTVTMKAWTGYIFPNGWSKATQELKLFADGNLLFRIQLEDDSTNEDGSKKPPMITHDITLRR